MELVAEEQVVHLQHEQLHLLGQLQVVSHFQIQLLEPQLSMLEVAEVLAGG
jgi:hypothetical protein